MVYLRIFWAFAYLLLFYYCVFTVVFNLDAFTLAEKLTFGLIISGVHLLSSAISHSKDS